MEVGQATERLFSALEADRTHRCISALSWRTDHGATPNRIGNGPTIGSPDIPTYRPCSYGQHLFCRSQSYHLTAAQPYHVVQLLRVATQPCARTLLSGRSDREPELTPRDH